MNKTIKKSIIIFILGSLLVGTVYAQSSVDLSIGTIAYGGSACPIGSVEVTQGSEDQNLSIAIGSIKAQAGHTSGFRMARSTCSIRIPVRVPSGYAVSMALPEIKGTILNPVGGSITLVVDSEIVGRKNKRVVRQISKEMNDQFALGDSTIDPKLQTWSSCGGEVLLGLTISATAVSNIKMEEAIVSIDPILLANNILIKRCL